MPAPGPEPRSPAGRVAPGLGRAMAAFYFFSFAGLGIYLPYFPLWLESHGFLGLRMSLIAALVPAMSALVPPWMGRLADRRGWRGGLLVAACVTAALSMTALAAADRAGAASSFAVVFVAVLGFACCRPPLIMVADRIALEAGGSYGRRRLWGSLGFLLTASAMGQWWPREQGYWVPLLVGLVFAVAALLALPLPRRAERREPQLRSSARQLLRQPRFLAFLLSTTLFFAAHASYNLCASLYFRDLGADGALTGRLWAIAVIAEVVVMAAMGVRLSRLRPEGWLLCALVVGVARWVWMALLPSASHAFVLQPLHGLCFALNLMATLEYARQAVGTAQMGEAQGLSMTAQSLGMVIGMLGWGPTYHRFGGRAVFAAAAALNGIAAIVVYTQLMRRPTRVVAAPAESTGNSL